MQAFGAVHLQHLRSAFAVLAAGIKKDTVVSPTAKPSPQVVENSILPTQSEENLNATQLADLISTQQNHTQILQSIANQLAELANLQKTVSAVSSASITPQSTENRTISKTDAVVETVDLFDFHPIAAEAETVENAQMYFSRLPWSSEMFADVAAKMRESQAGAEVPHIMQLATESALKTAAEAVVLSTPSLEPTLEVVTNNAQPHPVQVESLFAEDALDILQLDSSAQICGAYFQTLPWVMNVTATVHSEENSAVDILVIKESESETENLLLMVEPETQQETIEKTSEAYFQTLPWKAETETQVLEQDGNAEQNGAVDVLFVDEPALAVEELFSTFESKGEDDLQMQKICGDYFKFLPWVTESETPLSTDNSDYEQPVVDDFVQTLFTETQTTEKTPACCDYFQSLPWMTKKAVVDASVKASQIQAPLEKRKAMLEAIFANKAPITNEDFLQILEQETETLSQPVPESQTYFQTLPWG